jgi:beta-lactamase class D
VIPWDSVERQVPAWNKDNDMKTAFKNSTVWYYQELARRVGGYKMKYWLDKCTYGNADTSGGIDKFWLTGGLRISPEQQIDFIEKLYNDQLPFSKRSMNIVRDMMIMTDSSSYTLRGKTGWGVNGTTDIGWFVGYVETKGNVYFFCNRVYSNDPTNNDFARSRTEISMKALRQLEIIK